MENDQILFWDTDTNATVSLSRSKSELKQKIIASRLTGGHIVIRPAELFEGEEFYFNDAVNEDGFLYHLMKNHGASLALDLDSSLEERAEWRFRDGTVFDRGARYTDKINIEKIRKRTEKRAEKLILAGWKSCPFQSSRSKSKFETDLNLKIRYLLSKVVVNYIDGGLDSDISVNAFINGSVQVTSRSDIYDAVKNIWSLDVYGHQREQFISDCTNALTLSAISNTAENYGSRISEIKGINYNSLSRYSSSGKLTAAKVETSILKSFLRVLPKKIGRIESEKNHFAGAAFHLEARKFAEITSELITPRDREEINQLLYGESIYLDGHCISHHVYHKWDKLRTKDIDRLVEIRIDELSNKYGEQTGRSEILLSMMRSCTIEAVLLLLGAGTPFISTLANTLKDLKNNKNPVKPIFSGYSSKI